MKRFVTNNEPVYIDKLVPGGQGIGTLASGQKIFLWNALPGETVVEFTTTKVKSHYIEGYATKIENPSSHRIEPKDDCYLSTSPWQIMDYTYELEMKRELLLESFDQAWRTLGKSFLDDFSPASPKMYIPDVHQRMTFLDESGSSRKELTNVLTDGNDFHYRNKMEYSLYYDIEKATIFPAMRLRGTHRKVPLTTSSIERPEIWQKCQEIIKTLNDNHEDSRKYQSLLLRCDQQGNVEGGLYENYQPHPTFNNLNDTILGHEYSYSPNGFFQINLPVYEMALIEIKKHITSEKVLDLYSGVGTIGLSVARDKDLTLVEVDKFAYGELTKNAPANVKTKLAKAEEVLELIEPDQTVIVDPPRAGLDDKLTQKLLEVQPPTIIYLSCNPSTQARDLKKLLEKYEITKLVPFNFFPRTPHLENLAILHLK